MGTALSVSRGFFPWYGCAVDASAPLRRSPILRKTFGIMVGLLSWVGFVEAADAPLPTPPDARPPAEVLHGSESGADSLFAAPTTHDHVGRVVVPVSINGRGPFRFIVDTGANHSTISPDLVRLLGLDTNTRSLLTLDGITGAAQVSYVSIDRLQAGDLTLDNEALPVVWAPVMGGADGILGVAGMAQKSLVIDFKRNRVAIAGHIDSSLRDQATRIHGTRVSNGLIVLQTLVGGVHVAAVLDTGSERTLGNRALRDALRSQTRGKQGFVAQVTSVYGATEAVEPGEIQAAPLIVVGSLRISDVAIVYGDFHIFKVWQMQTRPAMILGMDVLGTLASLGIDFKNEYVYVGSMPAEQERFITSTHDLSSVQANKK